MRHMLFREEKCDSIPPLDKKLQKIYRYQNELTNSQNNLKQLRNQVTYYDKHNNKILQLEIALSVIGCGCFMAAFLSLYNYFYNYIFIKNKEDEDLFKEIVGALIGFMITFKGLSYIDNYRSRKWQNAMAYKQAKAEAKKLHDATDSPQAIAVDDLLCNSYISSYRKTAKVLESLMERFNDLTFHQQLQLVDLKLAEIDDAQRIFLKYCCPISKSFIVQPYKVIVEGKTREGNTVERQDWYDYHTFNRLNNTNRSPMSPGWTIKSVGFSDALNQQHQDYLAALEQKVTQLEQEPTLMPTCMTLKC